MRDVSMHDVEDTSSDLFSFMEGIPTQGYLGFSFGAMALSALFFLMGRNSIALFLGQWVPSIGIFALVYKLLRPSHERPVEEMKDTAREMGSKMKSAAGDMSTRTGMSH